MGTDVHQRFTQGDSFLKHLKSVNQAIGRLLKSHDKNDISLFIQVNSELELVEQAIWQVKQLANTLDSVGWWKKRVALSLIEEINHESIRFISGLALLHEKNSS